MSDTPTQTAAPETPTGPGITETQQPSKPVPLPIEAEARVSPEMLSDIGVARPEPQAPPQPYKHPLEAMLDGEERAARTTQDQITHETTDLLPAGEKGPSPAATPESAPSPEPPAPPAATPPLAPPVETAPEVPPPPAKRPQTPEENAAFAEARRAEKARKDAIEELQNERARLAALEAERARLLAEQQARERVERGEADPPAEVDPLTQLQQEVHQLRQRLEAKSIDDTLNQQAAAFQQQHPDYQQALQYYIEDERRDAEESGELAVVADRVLHMAAAQVDQLAREQGLTRNEAAQEIAVGVIFEARKQALVAAQQRTGKSVVETIYNRATRRGFKASNGNGNGNGTSVAPAPELPPSPDPQISAHAQIEEQQRRAASEALSTLPRSNATPPKNFQSRSEVAAYLSTLSVQEGDRFMDRMDRQDPRWMERLPA